MNEIALKSSNPVTGAIALGGVLDAAKVVLVDPTTGNPGLISGEDQATDTLRVISGAATMISVIPLTDTLGFKPNSDVVMGTIGAAGDIVTSVIVNVQDNTKCAVYVRDGDAPDPITGTTGTAPTASSTLVLTSTASSNVTANQYAGRVLSITYIPTGGTAAKFKRLITAHAAVTISTAWTSITVDEAVPAGATITQWAIEHQSSVQLVGPAQPDKRPIVLPGFRSVNGRIRFSVDSGCQIQVAGKFI